MQVLTLLAAAVLICTAEAAAEPARFEWPLRPPAVVRVFDAPEPDWQRGHRGVDLAGTDGQPVLAAGAGTVVFAGDLAGRPLVSVAHPGGLRTSYEPVRPQVRPGQRVAGGDVIGRLLPGHRDCAGAACLHWGAMWGPASAADYVDPLGLLATTPIRLKPLRGRLPLRNRRKRPDAPRRAAQFASIRAKKGCDDDCICDTPFEAVPVRADHDHAARRRRMANVSAGRREFGA